MPKRSQIKTRSKKRTQRKSGSKKRTQRKTRSKKRTQRKSGSKKRTQRKTRSKKRTQRKTRSKKRTQRKTRSKKRTQRKTRSKKRSQRKSRSKKRSQHKSSRKGDDAKIIAYFKRLLKKYGKNYSLGGAWTHPITGNQVTVSDKAKRLLKEAKKEMDMNSKMCNVKRSPTNDKKDLIKEIRSYVKCYERKTGTNQDLSLERLKTEPVSNLKKFLKFYRNN